MRGFLTCGVAAVLCFAGCKPGKGTFSILQGSKNGHPIFVMVDTSLGHYSSKGDYPYFLKIATPLIHPTKDGLTNDEEAAALNDWEDEIAGEVGKNCRFVYIGRSTWNGTRELLYYVDSTEQVVAKLHAIAGDRPTRSFDLQSGRDPQWQKAEAYFATAN